MVNKSLSIEELPEEVRRWISSDETTRTITALARAYRTPDSITVIPRLIFEVVTNRTSVTHLPETISKELGINQDEAKEATNKIIEALQPVAEVLKKVGVDLPVLPPPPATVSPTHPPLEPPTTAPARPTKKQDNSGLLKPSVAETPFILHSEEEIKPQIETAPIETSPLRPMFYKAPLTSQSTEEKPLESQPIAARLELGVETQPVAESAPKMSRTPREEVRQVNYSEFRTALNNPFSPFVGEFKQNEDKKLEQKPATETDNKSNSTEKQSVPDTNVVNLKDLPL
jgi:hypothetical protein